MDAMELTIFGDAFNAFKTDFDQVLRHLLYNMEKKESEEAKIGIAFKISLTKDTAPDHEIVAYEAARDVIVPKFSHKIVSTLTVKDEKSGVLGGKNVEMVWDKDSQKYILRPLTEAKNGQISLFDAADEGAEESEDEVEIPDIEDGDGADDETDVEEEPVAEAGSEEE